MGEWLRDIFRDRPWWMNAVMVFAAFMTFVYVPWDLFAKPLAVDEEVWFGVRFTGFAAKLAAIPHWFVYAAGLYGLRRMRPWMRPAATLYVAQVAFSMLVWNVWNLGGFLGWGVGVVAAAPFAALAALFWNAEEAFRHDRPGLRERYGDWALVTGASSGIGAEFARALAREGLSVVLAARREDRLRELAGEIEKYCGVATRVVGVDLSDRSGAETLARAVDDLEVGLLVNNAGAGAAGRFDRIEPERLADQVVLNCLAPVVLSRHLLPEMRRRGRGALVFTGSVAGHQPLPLHAVYGATKAFDLHLGEALWQESREAGIDVLVLEPATTETGFQEAAGELPHAGEPSGEVVRLALDALGRQPSVISGWLPWIRAQLAVRVAPRDLALFVARRVMERRVPPGMR